MYRFSALSATVLVFVLLLSCSKGGDDQKIGVPRGDKPTLKISSPEQVSLQKYKDTVVVPFEFSSSDSVKQIDVVNLSFALPDNDLGISVAPISGTTPFTANVTIYTNPGAKAVDYIRRLTAYYDTLSAERAILVRVVENTNCNFLFTGHYSFKQILPSSPTPFISDIVATGTNMATITNFANTGKSVQAVFDCGNELITIPQQAFDTGGGYIRGSGSWGTNGLTINYTGFTGIYNYSGTIQGNR